MIKSDFAEYDDIEDAYYSGREDGKGLGKIDGTADAILVMSNYLAQGIKFHKPIKDLNYPSQPKAYNNGFRQGYDQGYLESYEEAQKNYSAIIINKKLSEND